VKPNLSIRIGSLQLKNPLMTASGTCGYGDDLSAYFDISSLGAIVTKSLTLKPKKGNEPQRITEVACGMLNSIGLANIGVRKFIEDKVALLKSLNALVIANIAAKRVDDYVSLAEILADVDLVSGLELNLSCPNVKEGGIEFGTDIKILAGIVGLVRKVFKRTILVKLTPNVTRIADFARAAESEGADAVTVANTYVGMAIDIRSRRPRIHTVTGGLSGPAIKPITLAKVFQVHNAVKIPIVASGGIFSWEDVVEYMIAGAAAVQIGTALFARPDVPMMILKALEEYLTAQSISSANELVGSLIVKLSDVPHTDRNS